MVHVQTIETSTIVDNIVGVIGYSNADISDDTFVDVKSAKEYINLYKRYGVGGRHTASVVVLDEPEFVIIEIVEFDEHTTTHTERRFIITEV